MWKKPLLVSCSKCRLIVISFVIIGQDFRFVMYEFFWLKKARLSRLIFFFENTVFQAKCLLYIFLLLVVCIATTSKVKSRRSSENNLWGRKDKQSCINHKQDTTCSTTRNITLRLTWIYKIGLMYWTNYFSSFWIGMRSLFWWNQNCVIYRQFLFHVKLCKKGWSPSFILVLFLCHVLRWVLLCVSFIKSYNFTLQSITWG